MTATTTAITQGGVISTTSHHKRDYAEKLRRLYPAQTRMLSLVKGSNVDAFGNVAYSGDGMIKKVAVDRLDPEMATYTPIDVIYACTGGSSTTAVIADTTGFQTGDTIVNTSTAEVAIVVTLTSATVLTVTPVTGGTWSCASGQYIIMLASTYEEGTARYSTVTKEPTTVKTYLQIFREGLTIADTYRPVKSHLNEKPVEMYSTDKMVHALRKIEGSMFFSKQATAGTTSATIGGTAYTVYSMKGLFDWTGTAIDMGGAFNWENWDTILYPQMPTTMKPDSVIYAFMSRKLAGTMNRWAQNSYLTMGANASGMRFGKKVKKYIMGGSLEVEPIVHDLFDTGGYDDSILFVQSEDLEYMHLRNLDINVRENAQDNAAMAKTDIIEGVVGIRSRSNGANIKWVKNCLKAA